MFILNILRTMLRNKEKNLIVRGIFLIGGWGLGLDRFYEGNKKGGVYPLLDGVLSSQVFYFLNTLDTNI